MTEVEKEEVKPVAEVVSEVVEVEKEEVAEVVNEEIKPSIESLMEEDGTTDAKPPLKEEFSMGGEEEDNEEVEGEKFSDSEDDD